MQFDDNLLEVELMPGKFEMEPEPGDLTPVVGAATDVSPLGRDLPKPAHELTADEDIDVADWDRVAAMTEFKKLLARKRKFIIPATVFFIAWIIAALYVRVAMKWDVMAHAIIAKLREPRAER